MLCEARRLSMSNKINMNNDYSYLFDSISNNSNKGTSSIFDSLNTSGSSFSLSDYASIKNGTYLKLAKEYVKNVENDAKSGSKTDAQIQEETANAKKVRTDVSALKKSTDALTTNASLFEKKEIKDKDGDTKMDYDRDAIYKALKSFADNYNAVIKSAGDSDDTSVLRNTLNMTKLTAKHVNMLSKVGFTIGEDNTLSVDEKMVKEADINSIKSMFKGAGSYADSVNAYAGRIDNYVVRNMQKNGTYTATGSYATTAAMGKTGGILDDYL